MSPDMFASAHPRRATDMIRVALEKKGVIGFIDIHDGMTLIEARTLIWENVENAPQEFQFVLDDGVPVSSRQENTQKVGQFYPVVKIRECRNGRSASMYSASQVRSTTVDSGGRGASEASPSSGKLCVLTTSGDEFVTWITDDYTFQQLRRDAARYWHLPASQVALTDADGCLWPEQARILSMMNIAELHEKKIILEYKVGALSRTADSAMSRRRSGNTTTPRAMSFSASATCFVPTTTKASGSSRYRTLSNDPASSQMSRGALDNPVEELWRIFSFYCVNGDSMELECIKAHQFNKLLRDSRVFNGKMTPAMVDIIYMSETKGKPQSSAKMNYNEFLNALVKVASMLHSQMPGNKHVRNADDPDLLFQKLITDHILPLASRWPTSSWEEHTRKLRKPDIVAFISKFLEPLLEIFMFYARSHTVHPTTGVKEFYMSFADYQRFVNDFAFANLQLSSVEAAQVFLASCSSPPFHAPLFSSSPDGDEEDHSTTNELSATAPPPAPLGLSVGSASSGSSVATIQRLLESVEGLVAYTFPENQVGKVCMGISAFLDSLGRTGLTAFCKTRQLKTIYCVKGVFHHLSRGLTRSRVLEILRNHGASSMRATKFYSGTVAFNNKFLDMWRYEGSPDYLTADMFNESAKLASSGISSASRSDYMHLPASQTLTVATSSRRLPTPSTLLDDRNMSACAGRGREALDRLVRSAFLRDSATCTTNNARTLQTDGILQTTMPLETMRDELDDSNTAVSCGDSTATTTSMKIDATGGSASSESLVSDECCETREPEPIQDGEATTAAVPEAYDDQPSAQLVTEPQSPRPTHGLTRDDKSFYESILLKGGVFKKYGQWGNPHRRFVWCSKELDAIYWRPLNKKNALAKEGVPVASIIAVLPGNSTRTRYAFMKHLSDGTNVLPPLFFIV